MRPRAGTSKPWNWRKGYKWSLSIGALKRHLNLFEQGIDYDLHEPDCPPDCKEHTGCHHLTAVVFHALALLTFKDEHPELDDRFKPATPAAGLDPVRVSAAVRRP